MRAFIVLCLVAAACAQYNYQPSGGVGGGSGLGGVGGGSGLGGVGGGSGLGGVGGPGGFGGVAPAATPLGDFPVAGNDAASVGPQGELEKEFYTFTANDNDFNDPSASNQLANSVKQGLRVIFIKGPENNGLEDAALALAKQAAQQETAIYVLNKQADLSDLANKLNNINTGNNNKPEVHFVKYRTPEDAANAQRAIQGQYDSLGGKSQNFNGGVAPVLNFASQPEVRAPAGAATAPGASYLPASIFRA
ncbi:harpin HrpN-like [Musca domestica]|uniref:Uncharacterized protein LOC101898161 n=1 Tax=Musca domestica TaxID=7370 RepID=A0A1I8NGU4_MUSDO|nr:harpin HrpN-like [Musca domestica]